MRVPALAPALELLILLRASSECVVALVRAVAALGEHAVEREASLQMSSEPTADEASGQCKS